FVGATHPVLSGPAVKNLKDSSIEEIVVTDTVKIPDNKKMEQLIVLCVGPLFAEAIKRIHSGESVGALFS
ncbi:MAG: ribose-phosphate pyrophosphokinase, partial [Desulfobacterales bacterium]